MSGPQRFPRAIFFDLDGTLLAPGSVLTERTRAALHAAARRGAHLVVATGGFSFRARRLARLLDPDPATRRAWALTHNGAACWAPGGALAHADTMPAAALQTCLQATDRGVWCVYEAASPGGRTAMYSAGRRRNDLHHFVWGPEPPGAAPDARAAAGDAPFGVYEQAPRTVEGAHLNGVLGAWCLGTARALAPLDALAAGDRLHGARYLVWTQRLGQILGRPRLRVEGRDVGPLRASKGAAAAWLCARLGVAPEDTAAFGDADNDVELLQFAGYPVAMANGTASVRALGREIAPPNTTDGVAQVLERWLRLRD